MENEISDEKWFSGNSEIRPQDKQLCVVILSKVIDLPIICLFLEKDCVFLDMRSIKKQISKTGKSETETVSYYTISWVGVDYWKPLSIPEDVKERVLEGVKKLCEVSDIQ